MNCFVNNLVCLVHDDGDCANVGDGSVQKCPETQDAAHIGDMCPLLLSRPAAVYPGKSRQGSLCRLVYVLESSVFSLRSRKVLLSIRGKLCVLA